jgi:hypothetical protein
MNENLKIDDGSGVYAQIEATTMSEADRQHALEALELAETIVDAVAWVARRLGELAERLSLKPSAKH